MLYKDKLRWYTHALSWQPSGKPSCLGNLYLPEKNKLVYDIIITLNMSSRLTFDADCDAHSVVIFRMMGTTLTRSLTG